MSTEDQAENGASLAAQRAAIGLWAAQREDVDGLEWVEESASAKNLEGRPGLRSVLDQMGDDWDVLVVARLDRLSRSVIDFMQLLERATDEGWQLVCLAPMVDMTDPYGKAMAGMAAVFAQLERELIGQRTREGIAAKKAQGNYSGGHPRLVNPDVERRIQRMSGTTRQIASELDALGIPAPMGGSWHHASVARIRNRAS